jgi:hypothetical protein
MWYCYLPKISCFISNRIYAPCRNALGFKAVTGSKIGLYAPAIRLRILQIVALTVASHLVTGIPLLAQNGDPDGRLIEEVRGILRSAIDPGHA